MISGLILIALLIGTTIVGGQKIELETNDNISDQSLVDTENMGYMIIDCDEIDCDTTYAHGNDAAIDATIPNYQDQENLQFSASYEIKNEGSQKEKFVFRIVLKKGLGPDSPVVDSADAIIDDRPAQNDDQTGELLTSFSINRRDFFDKTDKELNFRLELYCEYYRGPWLGGDLEEISDYDTWGICDVTLANQVPLKPSLTGKSKGNIDDTHSFSATTTDPEGDDIQYVFYWGNGDADETSFMNSGSTGSKSYKWDEKGTYTVSVFAYDRFYDAGPSATLSFSVPKPFFTYKLGFRDFFLSKILNLFFF
jgi:hypothetical protein